MLGASRGHLLTEASGPAEVTPCTAHGAVSGDPGAQRFCDSQGLTGQGLPRRAPQMRQRELGAEGRAGLLLPVLLPCVSVCLLPPSLPAVYAAD